MQYWLFKSEPDVWSWQQQLAKAPECEEWSGVRNYQARNNMRAMRPGDRGFFYHSNRDRAIMGIVEVCNPAHPDSTSDDPRWECVDVRAVAALPRPVTLAEIKADPRLSEMALVRMSRLSVQPVRPGEWAVILELAGMPRDPAP
ncbi:MAG: EVE domain-containing protein [Alphaproteobacteria bacterium]|nr:MAG: EVE domain-containing protein [Alphaproteobacteria bacterium]